LADVFFSVKYAKSLVNQLLNHGRSPAGSGKATGLGALINKFGGSPVDVVIRFML
jgi:hypothetical protein